MGITIWEWVLAGTGSESAVGTDLGSLAGKGDLFGPLVKSWRCLVRWVSRPEQTWAEAEPGLSQPEQRRREITWTWWLRGVEIPAGQDTVIAPFWYTRDMAWYAEACRLNDHCHRDMMVKVWTKNLLVWLGAQFRMLSYSAGRSYFKVHQPYV